MKKLLFLFFSFLLIKSGAQQIAFKKDYPTGAGSRATAFTELRSSEFLIAYNWFHPGPDVLEMHLLKTDKNGVKLWDRVIRVDTPQSEQDQFSTQSIAEQEDGSLFVDVVYPYGEKYLLKLDANGVQKWEAYLHNSFGDYSVHDQLMKQRSKNIAINDGSSIVLGASFLTMHPRATIVQLDAEGLYPYDHYYYRGYFNDAHYQSFEHLYTVGVEQSDTGETLVFSDLDLSGAVNYHQKIWHGRNVKIQSTALFYSLKKFRVAESICIRDTGFYVNVYDFLPDGTLISTKKYRLKCNASNLNVNNYEVDFTVSNKCQAADFQTFLKMNTLNNTTGFTFKSTFDNTIGLQKTHDAGYAFAFNNPTGVHLWKINMAGTSQTGTAVETGFVPNPVKDLTTYIRSPEMMNKAIHMNVFDSYGHPIISYDFAPTEPVTLSLGNVAAGAYHYKMTTDDGTVVKGKLIKFIH